MRPLFFLLLLVFAASTSDAQKLKVNEVDKFTKKKRLETNPANLKQKLTEGIAVSFRSVDSSLYVSISGYGAGVFVIGEADKAIFLLDNDSTVTVYSTGIQTYQIGKYGNYYSHQYRMTLNDLALFKDRKILSIRRSNGSVYADMDIPPKNQGDAKPLAKLMLDNL